MRQKKTSIWIRRLLPVFAAAMILTGIAAYAEVPVIGTDVSAPAADCIFLGLEGTYFSDPEAAVALINEIRWEACVEGVFRPGTTQPLTTSDYVPIKWSGDLEFIARIRAAEAAVTMDHERTNERSIWGLKSPGGVRSYGEVLAWNWSENVLTGINQWYGEKSDWVNQTPGAVTGHYTAMINPTNIYVGIAAFCSDDTDFYNCTAGEFTFVSGLDETPMSFTGACIQKLEVNTSHIDLNGEISGKLSGEKGDTSSLVFKTTASYDSYYGPISSRLLVLDSVTWSSAAPDVVSVDPDGTATANYCGRAAILASAGDFSATAEFSVNHRPETIPAKAAGCTETGLTEGKRCTVCSEVLQAQTVIPATGHSWNGWTVTKAATYDAEGEEQRVCGKNASHIEKRTIAKKVRPTETSPAASSGTASGSSGSTPISTGTAGKTGSGTASSAETALTPETEVNEAAASAAAAQEKKILMLKSDSDPKGSTYGLLQAAMKKAGKTSITLKWKKVKGAKSYIVFGNKCGKKNKYKKLKTVKGTSFTQKKLKKGTYYKYLVVAVKDGKAVATSKTIHTATTGGSVGNPKSVKVKKKTLKVAAGKTGKISASAVPASKKLKVRKHRAIAFESSNTNIATVSKKGVVKGVRSGTCYVYAYAQNGVMAKVKVIVG